MKKLLLTTALAAGLCAGNALAQQKKAERDPEVDKAIGQVYPDTPTEIQSVDTVNGVKVYNILAKTKAGETTARVTEHGDFLTYGSAQQEKDKGLSQMLTQNAGSLFKNAPADVQLYRATNYYVDIPATSAKAKAQNAKQTEQQEGRDAQNEQFGYRVRFDAVGRVLDIQNPDEVRAEFLSVSDERVTDQALAKRITEKARP